MLHNELTYGAIQLFNGIACLSLGFFVLSRKSNNRVHISFFGFCFSLSFWMLTYFFWIITNDKGLSLSESYFKLLMLGTIFIHSTHLYFILTLIKKIKEYFTLLTVGYGLSIFFVYLNFSNMLYDNYAHPKSFFSHWPDANVFTTAFIIIQSFYLFFSLFLLFKHLNVFRHSEIHKYRLLLIITPISFCAGLTNWLLWYNIPVPPIGNIIVPLYPLGVMFLILKYRLLNIEIVIRKSIIYSILVTVISILYFLIVSLSENIFRGLIGYRSIPLTILFIAMFAILYQPLKNAVQVLVDKVFFKGTLKDLRKENIRLMDELQRGERMRSVGTLAAGLAHEIKNPLTSIKTFTEFLEEKHDDAEFRNKYKRIVGGEVERINCIVQQLLDFAKPKPLSLNKVNLHTIIDDTLSFLSIDLIKKRISSEKIFKCTNPVLMADSNKIKQTLLNIILNSIDAMHNGGNLKVYTYNPSPNKISIKIVDTGDGISEEDLKHIFDPFYTTKDTGSGLGLPIVHSIIEEHGGELHVESSPGKGTSFEITL